MKNLIFDAIEFAAVAHHGQIRKLSNVPYIIHPINVMKIILKYNKNKELAIAALLHDVIEDTSITIDEINNKFGEKITNLVKDVTEDKSKTWEHRKQHTINQIKTAKIDTLYLICADKLDNILDLIEQYQKLGESIWDNFKRGKKDQEWYYKSLAKNFLKRSKDQIFQDLSKKVNEFF